MNSDSLWRDIEGYEGKYQVSYFGEIRRLCKNGKIKLLSTFTKSKRHRLIVGLTKDSKKTEIHVHQLVARAFLEKPNDGEVVYHINGILKDNCASNLKYISKKELGKLTGAQSGRQGVCKIDNTGEIVDFYSSARKAAKENFMSYQTIINRCNGKVKSPFAPDGFAYAWEDDEWSIKRVIKKIKGLGGE